MKTNLRITTYLARGLGAAFFSLIGINSASAHTPYLLPATFEPVLGDVVTLDASFAERFFIPEVAFDNGAFHVIAPDGSTQKPNQELYLKTRTVVEHELSQEGTYRFSTGKRVGGFFTVYEEKGERKTGRGENFKLPVSAKLIETYKSVTVAEAYVSKGAPNDTATKARNNGLEIVALHHPNDISSGDDHTLQVLFNGKALADADIDIYRAANQFSTDQADAKVTSDPQGKFQFHPQQEGVYLLRVRHRAPATDHPEVNSYSHTYTLVLEAF